MVSQIENSSENLSLRINQNLSIEDQLIQFIQPLIDSLGYEVINLEINSRQRTLQIFIDFKVSENTELQKTIGIEDCVRVSHQINEPLDEFPLIHSIFKNDYELEVSSPGLSRPLRNSKDYQRFLGKKVCLHLYRPMILQEIENEEFFKSSSKSKIYTGILIGLSSSNDGEKVLLSVPLNIGKPLKGQKSKKSQLNSSKEQINKIKLGQEKLMTEISKHEIALSIPLKLIAKANLEPDFNFENSYESELKT